MGNKDKRRHKHRSRSTSRERIARHERDDRTRRKHDSNSVSEDSDSDSSYRGRKKHKHRSRSRSPDHRRHSENSSNSQDSDSNYSSKRRKKHKGRKSKSRHKRSRSRSRDRHSKRPEEDKPELTAEQIVEEKRKEKELMKALETPEEKRARRLAKKEAKERQRKANMGWDEEYMGYTNTDNPFGDEHLLDTFVWKKKMEKEGVKGLAEHDLEKMHKQKMIENKIELEKVKKRRVEREHEREERELEREMLQREKEAEYFQEWEKQEDSFHLKQAKLRSKIRIDDGRAKPIDLLGKYISAEDDDLTVEMHEPYTYLNGLTVTDLEDLLEDIKVYMELEEARNTEYWRDITIIADEEISKLRKIDPTSRDYLGERRSGINTSVTEEVNTVFKGKTLSQLAILEDQIRKKLTGGEGVDVGYWESLLQQLKAHMARTRLRERHQDQLRRKLFKLKEEQGIESVPLFPIMKEEGGASSGPPSPAPAEDGPSTSGQELIAVKQELEEAGPSTSADTETKKEPEEEPESVLDEDDLLDQSCVDYSSGQYSPVMLTVTQLEPDTIVYDPEDDMKRLEYARKLVLQTGKAKKDTEDELVRRAREGMTGEEAQFSVEVPLEQHTLLWSDKYRPRKPRFFNRVHTGFEWNKYNQTHYDIDNPPPKIVQGYKFNIFYPDLIDKSKPPEYTLNPIEDNRDFCTLRFHAGPPYEDIAFKIVSREWEYSYKRGFRCQFHNNIFQLWFHFKRYRYRR